jgi:hypothetical protein
MPCVIKLHTEVVTDSVKIGRRNRSTGNNGIAWLTCRRTSSQPTATAPTNSPVTAAAAWPWPMPLMPQISAPNITADSAALHKSNRCSLGAV